MISGTGGDTLRLTGTATNENGTVPLATVNLPVNAGTTALTTLLYPPSFQGTTIVLTVDLVNSSPDFVIPSGPKGGQAVNTQTYTFTLVQPVPEPASLVLVTTGIAGLAVRVYRRKKLSGWQS